MNSLTIAARRLFSRYVVSITSRTCTSISAYRLFSSMMDRAVVRCLPGEQKLTISLVLDGSHKHLLRDQAEELGRALQRISSTAAKGQAKDKKKKNKGRPAEVAEPVVVRLCYNGEPVCEDVLNSSAWQTGSELQVGVSSYRVERNPPTLTLAELPAALLSGFPVCARMELEFGRLEDSVFTWYKESVPDSDTETDNWVEVGNQRVFVPSNQDIGSRLKLKCTPRDGVRDGLEQELVSVGSVEAGPGTCTFDNRHMYTNKVTDNHIVRIVCYNILADIYAQTELSKTVLYPYCAPYALERDYRQSLIKKELAGYNADIICLQEVDKAVFTDSLSPALDAYGMDGLFRIKGQHHEGLATYYRRSKFKLLSQHDIRLSEALTSDPIHAELLDKVSTNPTLKEKVLHISTTLQVSVLQSVPDSSKKICVANTHLYWYPKGGNVRLIQISVCLRHLQQVISEAAPGAPLLFSGDFNSTPSSGVFQLFSLGSVPETHPDWASNGPEEACPMEATNPFRLASACGEPAYTNYVGGFHGCLDYIFVEPQALQVEQVIPLPSHQEVTTHQALPSVSHPSDHIALVCDLTWK